MSESAAEAFALSTLNIFPLSPVATARPPSLITANDHMYFSLGSK
jgi:hypothetical protein